MQYVSSAGAGSECIFCGHRDAADDGSAGVLFRGDSMFVLLNAYPYNTGHVMIAPLRHVADIGELSEDERAELMTVTHRATEALRKGLNPEGFNIGMNLGSAAGAGIPGHLHMHVVPRWSGDTNYMTTIGDTKVLPQLLADTYRTLHPLFS